MCLRVLFLSFFMKICFSLFKRIAMHLFFNPGIKHFFAMASMEGIDVQCQFCNFRTRKKSWCKIKIRGKK
jgi:hypothetical protein